MEFFWIVGSTVSGFCAQTGSRGVPLSLSGTCVLLLAPKGGVCYNLLSYAQWCAAKPNKTNAMKKCPMRCGHGCGDWHLPAARR